MIKKVSISLILLILISGNFAVADTRDALTLEQAIDIALENNEELRQSQKTYQQRKKELKVYQNRYDLRHFDLNLKNSYALWEKNDDNIASGAIFSDTTLLKVNKELSAVSRINLEQRILSYDEEFSLLEGGNLRYSYDFFSEKDKKQKYDNQLSQKELAVFEQKEEIKDLTAELKEQTINKYYNLLELREKKALKRSSLKQAEKTLEIVKARLEANNALTLDKKEAELEVDNRKLALGRLESEQNLARLDLAEKLEKELAEDIKLVEEEKLDFAYDKDEIKKSAYENNNNLAILAKKIEQQQKELDYISNKNNFNLQTIGELAWSDEDFVDDYSLGIEFSYNFNTYQKEEDDLNIKQEKQTLTELKQEKDKLRKNLNLEIERDYAELNNYKEEINFSKREIENKEKALKIAEEKYQKGLITVNDLLEKQLSLLNKEVNYVEKVLLYNSKVYQMKNKTRL